ncbi:MAG: SpoIID/LytB domain-containing protein [Marmoricola sp.]
MRALRVLLVVGSLAVALLPAGAAQARRGDVAPGDDVALTGPTFLVAGHGFGHGHGMSQYGAQGAAKQGLTAPQIVAFYYPGTKAATWSGRRIRVLLTADTTRDLQVLAQPGLTVVDRGTGTTYPLNGPRWVTRWRLGVASGHSIVQYRGAKTSWHRYRLPGGPTALVGDGELHAPHYRFTLVTPTGQVPVQGVLRSVRPSPNSRDRMTVDVLTVENYLRGVVPAEMPASWLPAALQSQAIAARTYALRLMRDNARGPYDTCDTTACQVYAGPGAAQPSTDQAIAATRGQYLTYQGVPILAQFGSSNGGQTSAGPPHDYLVSQADPYDDDAGKNPYSAWSTTVKVADLAAAARRAGHDVGTPTRITITQREGCTDGCAWNGRAVAVDLTGTGGTWSLSADAFRSLLGLRSTWFAIDR